MATIPIFSVIIPIFNGEKTLVPVLESIKNQTYKDFELILYDDASTDKSVELVKLCLNDFDGKFLIVEGKKNKGNNPKKSDKVWCFDESSECMVGRINRRRIFHGNNKIFVV